MAYEYKGYNPKNAKHVQKYVNSHYKKVTAVLPIEYFENVMKPLCDSLGLSISTFAKIAIENEVNRIMSNKENKTNE